MPKRKKAAGTKVTLKAARMAIRMMPDGHRRLTLSNMGIVNFPKCLLKLKTIDELDLSRNLIETIPENISKLASLRWLDLHSNKLKSLPESIGSMVSLVHLNVANNHLTSAGVPSTLGSLGSLKSLNLGMNQLDSLPLTLVALDGLQELGLFDNHFREVPELVKVHQNHMKVNMKRNPCSQGDQLEKKDVYLPHQNNLCSTCLKKCQMQRERRREKGGGESSAVLIESKWTFYTLLTPNSVAIATQDVWRMKEHVKSQQTK